MLASIEAVAPKVSPTLAGMQQVLTTVSSPDDLPLGCRPARAAPRQGRLRRAPGVLAMVLVLAAGAAGCAARSGPPVGGNAVADAQTAVRVKTALVNNVELGTLPIDVQASGGVVTLHGTVAEEAQVERALAVARGVAGVARAVSELKIGEPEPSVDRGDQTLPALAPRPEEGPVRLIGAGISVRRTNPSGDGLAHALSIGPLLRLRPRNGLGATVAFNWTDTEIETSPGGQPGLAALQLRPVMAGAEYGFVRGRLAAGLSLVGGYSFNSLDVDTRVAGAGRAVAVGNSFVWRPGASLWYDVAPRFGINLFGGYLFARPKVTFASDTAVVTHRLRANAVVLSVGAAYWIF